MLQDHYLPVYHFRENHEIEIQASPSRIYSVATDLDLSGSWITRTLFTLRGLPGSTVQGIDGLKSMGFTILEQQPDKEIILGLIGQFWKVNGNIQHCSKEEFISFDRPEFARATWNFEIAPAGDRCILKTETRIQCLNQNSEKKFSHYWRLIRPFSGLIRMEMLRIVRKRAEAKT